MESLLQQPHLIDGALGRFFAFIAVSVIIGIWIFRHYLKIAIPDRALIVFALSSNLIGILFSFNSALYQIADPFSLSSMTIIVPSLDDARALIETRYGQIWILFACCLFISGIFIHYKIISCISILTALFCLSFTGHAGEAGIGFPLFLDFLHLTSVLIWIGGLVYIVTGRLTSIGSMDAHALRTFSKFILPVFLLGLATGIIKLIAQYRVSNALNDAYLAFLCLKLTAVIGVCVCALWLRRILFEKFEGDRYDHGITIEVFFAVLLLLSTALVTQLPPR